MSNLPTSIKANKYGSKYILSPTPHVDNSSRLPLNMGKLFPYINTWDKDEIMCHHMVGALDKQKGSHHPTNVAWNKTKQLDTPNTDVTNKGAQQTHLAENTTYPSITTNELGKTSTVNTNMPAYTHDCIIQLIDAYRDAQAANYDSTTPPHDYKKRNKNDISTTEEDRVIN